MNVYNVLLLNAHTSMHVVTSVLSSANYIYILNSSYLYKTNLAEYHCMQI